MSIRIINTKEVQNDIASSIKKLEKISKEYLEKEIKEVENLINDLLLLVKEQDGKKDNKG